MTTQKKIKVLFVPGMKYGFIHKGKCGWMTL
jgi:hypothetical protein